MVLVDRKPLSTLLVFPPRALLSPGHQGSEAPEKQLQSCRTRSQPIRNPHPTILACFRPWSHLSMDHLSSYSSSYLLDIIALIFPIHR